ncbi:Transposable element tcb2 transposase [Caligus rogercresseyi]|uniref:Transposable element tcb2 transposase n=1 Tax=Caligus rogercresseyi TaxID=217165 RepID=A0A7T8JYM1_CALRO|nr:Transposable element tcb2 transposase [Caligus rogercresseyi]
MRKQAKNLGVSKDTIRNAVQDLGLVSYVRRRRQLLSDASNETRVIKSKKLLTLDEAQRVLGPDLLRQEAVDSGSGPRQQNDRYLAYCIEEVPPINTTKHPASAMMLGVVSSDGNRMPPFWFPKGLKIGAKEYLEVMQNDSTPGHKAKITQNGVRRTWQHSGHGPSSSPDCNPLDYGIWGVVERKTCSIPHASVDALKAAVEKEWAEMSVDFIVKTCKAFRPQIEAMLKANGGHFEL